MGLCGLCGGGGSTSKGGPATDKEQHAAAPAPAAPPSVGAPSTALPSPLASRPVSAADPNQPSSPPAMLSMRRGGGEGVQSRPSTELGRPSGSTQASAGTTHSLGPGPGGAGPGPSPRPPGSQPVPMVQLLAALRAANNTPGGLAGAAAATAGNTSVAGAGGEPGSASSSTSTLMAQHALAGLAAHLTRSAGAPPKPPSLVGGTTSSANSLGGQAAAALPGVLAAAQASQHGAGPGSPGAQGLVGAAGPTAAGGAAGGGPPQAFGPGLVTASSFMDSLLKRGAVPGALAAGAAGASASAGRGPQHHLPASDAQVGGMAPHGARMGGSLRHSSSPAVSASQVVVGVRGPGGLPALQPLGEDAEAAANGSNAGGGQGVAAGSGAEASAAGGGSAGMAALLAGGAPGALGGGGRSRSMPRGIGSPLGPGGGVQVYDDPVGAPVIGGDPSVFKPASATPRRRSTAAAFAGSGLPSAGAVQAGVGVGLDTGGTGSSNLSARSSAGVPPPQVQGMQELAAALAGGHLHQGPGTGPAVAAGEEGFPAAAASAAVVHAPGAAGASGASGGGFWAEAMARAQGMGGAAGVAAMGGTVGSGPMPPGVDLQSLAASLDASPPQAGVVEFGLELGRDVSLVEGGFLGCGATGVVYRGELRGWPVAVKMIPPRSVALEGLLLAAAGQVPHDPTTFVGGGGGTAGPGTGPGTDLGTGTSVDPSACAGQASSQSLVGGSGVGGAAGAWGMSAGMGGGGLTSDSSSHMSSAIGGASLGLGTAQLSMATTQGGGGGNSSGAQGPAMEELMSGLALAQRAQHAAEQQQDHHHQDAAADAYERPAHSDPAAAAGSAGMHGQGPGTGGPGYGGGMGGGIGSHMGAGAQVPELPLSASTQSSHTAGAITGTAASISVMVPPVGVGGGVGVGAHHDMEDEAQGLLHELEILGQLSHPNIVRVYGGCLRPPSMFVVQELMTGGTLSALIHARPSPPGALPAAAVPGGAGAQGAGPAGAQGLGVAGYSGSGSTPDASGNPALGAAAAGAPALPAAAGGGAGGAGGQAAIARPPSHDAARAAAVAASRTAAGEAFVAAGIAATAAAIAAVSSSKGKGLSQAGVASAGAAAPAAAGAAGAEQQQAAAGAGAAVRSQQQQPVSSFDWRPDSLESDWGEAPWAHAPGGGHASALLPLQRILQLTRDVATGLAYLHSLDIVHRDLKPANILLDGQGRAKIGDFGLARVKYKTYLSSKRLDAGTICYMAPESFDVKVGGMTTKCDIFSLGVIIWEMLTGQRPWAGLKHVAIIYQVALLGCRPGLPADPGRCPPRLAALVEACWAGDQHARPSAQQVVEEVGVIAEELGLVLGPPAGAAQGGAG